MAFRAVASADTATVGRSSCRTWRELPCAATGHGWQAHLFWIQALACRMFRLAGISLCAVWLQHIDL
eukprot:6471482-Amphidinium_carterae.1